MKTLKAKSFTVFVITLVTMAVEIYFGLVTNSMALLADGLHMGTHALVLGITCITCLLSSRFLEKSDKINTVGGKINAVFLLASAASIIYESVERFFDPLEISFSEAIFVALIGLAVNMVCMFIMKDHDHGHEHNHNLNYKSAYVHIISDAMTSVFAILALFGGKYLGYTFLDSVMGVVGGLIILRWSMQLLFASRTGPHCHSHDHHH
jgi:cation diffusion facilitator family transporter